VNLEGQHFGRWRVVRREEPDFNGNSRWQCICDCGKEGVVRGDILQRGYSRSCGCLQKEIAREQESLPQGEASFNELFGFYKSAAKRRGIPFLLLKSEFRQLTMGDCHYCHRKPSTVWKQRANNGDYLYNGIDRLDSDGPYSVENCVSCCNKHNLMKRDMPLKEFIKACKEVVESCVGRLINCK
jgi:hypothetical protein